MSTVNEVHIYIYMYSSSYVTYNIAQSHMSYYWNIHVLIHIHHFIIILSIYIYIDIAICIDDYILLI